MSIAERIAESIRAGQLDAVPTVTPWPWDAVCRVFDGVPYVWGTRDCSAMFHACGLVAGHIGPRLTTAGMRGFPTVPGPVPGAAALFGDVATGTPTHVARVVRSGSGLALWHAHGGGSGNTAKNPGGPAGLSPITYDSSRLLGWYVVVPEVSPAALEFLRGVRRDDLGPFLAFLRQARALPAGV